MKEREINGDDGAMDGDEDGKRGGGERGRGMGKRKRKRRRECRYGVCKVWMDGWGEGWM